MEEKREEGWRGRWIWERMSNIMHKNGGERGLLIWIRSRLMKTYRSRERNFKFGQNVFVFFAQIS